MNEGNSKLPQIILLIFIVIIGFLLFKFVIFNDFSQQDEVEKNTSKENSDPALTLKSDKQAEAELKQKEEEEKKAEEEKSKDKKDKSDDKKDKDKKDKKDEKAKMDEMRNKGKDNALKVLEIQAKPQDKFKEKSTQTLFSDVATEDYVKGRKGNKGADDRTIEYKNVDIDISDDELKKSNPKGTLKFDRLINPKDKKSKIKPSTEIDSKVSVTFKKEGDTLKVDGMQT